MTISQNLPQCKVTFSYNDQLDEKPVVINLQGSCQEIFQHLQQFRFDEIPILKGSANIQFANGEIDVFNFSKFISLEILQEFVKDRPTNTSRNK